MASTSWKGGTAGNTGNWFTVGNWSNGVPVTSLTGTQVVTISGTVGNLPTLSPLDAGANNVINVTQNGVQYQDVQIDGQFITLSNNAILTIQGAALGHLVSSPTLGSIANLTAATSSTASYDQNLVISSTGTNTLFVNDVNHNFGLIEAVGTGNTLKITVAVGGNVQAAHGLYNYGEILAGTNSSVNILVSNPAAGNTTNFANAGYVMVQGGTFMTTNSITDGANVPNPVGTPDGYIEISGGGTAALLGSVSSTQEVLFSGTGANVLEIANGNSFQGNVAGFQTGDTIQIQGVTASVSLSYAGSILSAAELNSAGTVTATSTINIGSSYSASQFVDVFNTTGVNIVSGSSALTKLDGSIVIDYGESVTLANTTGVDSIPVTFGTHGSLTGLNTLEINGSVSGTSSPYIGTISGFGLNDDIVLGSLVLPSVAAGSQVSLAYANSVLTVNELNSSGTAIGTTSLDVGPGYSTSSFVALIGTNGVNIETPSTVIEAPLTFTGTAGVISSFEDPSKYAGKLAPGSSIVAGETVSITAGSASIASTSPVANAGLINVTGPSSVLIDSAALTGAGTVSISSGGQVTLANATGIDTNLINFGTGGTSLHPNLLDLSGTGTTSFAGTIANFGTFDTIVLASSVLPGTETSFSTLVSGGIETLTVTSSVGGVLHTDNLTFAAALPPGVFSVTNSPAGIVVSDVPCFVSGTRILTNDGYRAVESLKVGDSVLTMRDGSPQKITWVGQRRVDLSRHANPEKAQPVRICAGAFAEGLPERDLCLSPDHALFIGGHLIEAKTLVNGATIIQDKTTQFVTYHHIELAMHDVVLAEGLETETYLDSGNRQNFAAQAQAMALHPDFVAQSRTMACAPLLTDGELVRTTRQQLLNRAQELGFTTTADIAVTVKLNDTLIKPEIMEGELLFVLPSAAASIELISATGVPAEISASPDDRRELGLAVTTIALVANGTRHLIALDDDRHEGFFAMETGQRWTNGTTRIALPAYHGRAILEITFNGQAVRWAQAA